jgi:hypothetical protein
VDGRLGCNERPRGNDSHNGAEWKGFFNAQTAVELASIAWDDAGIHRTTVVDNPIAQGGGGRNEVVVVEEENENEEFGSMAGNHSCC